MRQSIKNKQIQVKIYKAEKRNVIVTLHRGRLHS